MGYFIPHYSSLDKESHLYCKGGPGNHSFRNTYQKEQNIPYRSITDFVLKRGPFDRYLGIGTIQVQTAGQSQTATGYEGCLSGLLDYDGIHGDLRDKLKSLHPVSESTTTSEPINLSNENVLTQILEELKKIRKNTER